MFRLVLCEGDMLRDPGCVLRLLRREIPQLEIGSVLSDVAVPAESLCLDLGLATSLAGVVLTVLPGVFDLSLAYLAPMSVLLPSQASPPLIGGSPSLLVL